MNIVFYNHYHNGDIFASKAYVEDIIKEFKGANFYYQHPNSPRLLRDVDIEFRDIEAPLGALPVREKFRVSKDTIFINTWIGNYLNLGSGINWPTYHKMFNVIYEFLYDETDNKIPLGPVEYYIPEIRYDYFDIPDVTIPENSVIISNGPVMSGQSNLQNIDSIVNSILEHTDYSIILTHFSPFNSDRVYYTNNITNIIGGDLNEISWIAEQCKYIIGRNSGPFCFMHTKKILNDRSKTIISLGNKAEDSFTYGMELPSNYQFILDDAPDLNDRILKAIK